LFVEYGRRRNQNVRNLTLGHSLGELRRGIELYLNLVAACVFELFCRAQQSWFNAPADRTLTSAATAIVFQRAIPTDIATMSRFIQ